MAINHNDAILAEPKHQELMTKLKKDTRTKLSPGGATQNTLRQASTVLSQFGSDIKCAYIGGVGKDEAATLMARDMHSAGLEPLYLKTDSPTGECLCLINDKDRSLITELGACVKYDKEHLLALEKEGVLKDIRIA